MSKQRNRWTPEEDSVLATEVTKLTNQGRPRDWTAIAEALPGRSNKDCRKRWCNNLVGNLKKGPWDMDEDERLRAGIREHGDHWTLVAEEVGGRSADQCAKRWHHFLDPTLDQSKWTEEEEQLLSQAVKKHGRFWRLIQTEYFPGRASNNVKNRYVTMTRRRSGSTASDAKQNGMNHQIRHDRQDRLDSSMSSSRATSADNIAPSPFYQEDMTMVDYSDSTPFTNQPHHTPYHDRNCCSYGGTLVQAYMEPAMSIRGYHPMEAITSQNTNPHGYHDLPVNLDDINTDTMSSSMVNFDNYLSAPTYGHGYGHGMTMPSASPEVTPPLPSPRSQAYALTINDPSSHTISNVVRVLTRSNTRFQFDPR